MKRFICVLIICLMVVPAAFATDFENFNIHAELFGAHEVKESEGDVRDDYIRFIQDGCTITFKIADGRIAFAMITGDGDAFLAYSLATMAEFDAESQSIAHNGGQLLLYYLMSKSEDEGKHTGATTSGAYFQVEKENGKYNFLIGN